VARFASIEDDPVARALVFAQWTDMAVRYGGDLPCDEDEAIPHGSFEAPEGAFLVVESAGRAVGCGGFRRCDDGPPGTAEVKRLFTVPEARGLGVARFLMAEIEALAAAYGYERLWLETGTAQPEALALYDALAYARILPYGEYKDSPQSVSFAKDLRPDLPGSP
jgi:GNAT superfamily N-acetyltransferase